METVTFTAENHIIDYILSVVANFPPEKISFIELKNENAVLLNTNKLEDLQEFLLTRNT